MVEINIDSLDGGKEETAPVKKKAATAKKEDTKKAAKDNSEAKTNLEKKNSINAAIKAITKSREGHVKFGNKQVYKSIPTGILILDHIIGLSSKNADLRGYPRGRIVDVFGWESTGKTTMMTASCIEAQKLGLHTAYIDYEKVFDFDYAVAQGLDISEDKFTYVAPAVMEDLDPVMSELIKAGVDFIVVDSVPAMTTTKTMEGETETLALKARYMAQYLPKWNSLITDRDATITFINQMRDNIGGHKESKSTGGRALPFFASLRIELSVINKETRMRANDLTGEKDKAYTANVVKATIVKNKVGIPGKSGEFRIVFGEGVDNMHTLRSIGEQKGVVIRSGAYFTYTSPKDANLTVTGQGSDAFDKYFIDSPVLYNDLREAVGL